MPNKHVYFAIGALHGAAVIAWVGHNRHAWFEHFRWVRALYRWDRDWFLYFPLGIAFFGALALVPDILLAFELLPKKIIRSNVSNIFYGYAWFEQIEDANPAIDHLLNTLGSVVLYGLSLGVLGFYAKELSKQ